MFVNESLHAGGIDEGKNIDEDQSEDQLDQLSDSFEADAPSVGIKRYQGADQTIADGPARKVSQAEADEDVRKEIADKTGCEAIPRSVKVAGQEEENDLRAQIDIGYAGQVDAQKEVAKSVGCNDAGGCQYPAPLVFMIAVHAAG